MKNYYKNFILLLTALVISACSSVSSPPLPKSNNASNDAYLIGPGDQLQIFVWRNADLSTNVIVRPDGRISSPLIDDLLVTGMKPKEVSVLVADILSKYIREPQVSIIVSGFHGTSEQQVKVIGNATNPKVLPYKTGMTLLDVMIAVQGLTDFADGDNAQLVRTVNGKKQQYTVYLDSLIRKGDITKNRLIHPGDTIIIPEAWF